MMRAVGESERLTPELVLRAYTLGIFPMARCRGDPLVTWVAPERRGIIPLSGFRVPRRLRRVVRGNRFRIRCDTAFAQVVAACAAPAPGRTDTWINAEIENTYLALHRLNAAHSIEAWTEDGLVGGLYGVRIGAAFFGESMFSFVTDASKVALVHLVARLKRGGFMLLDAQFVTDHLRRFGAIEVPADDYRDRLDRATQARAEFYSDLPEAVVVSAVEDVLTQSSTQMS